VAAEPRSHLNWLIALALLVLAVALRLPGMIGWWINPDEGAYFSMVTWKEWEPFWTEVAGHAHPPLYYVLLRLVGLLTHEFFWLRAVALVSGTLAVLLAFLVGTELGGNSKEGTWLGAIAGLVLAMSQGAILISQIMRPYALLLALSIGAFWSVLKYRRHGQSRYLVYYSLLLSLTLLTHYSSMFVLATLGSVIVSDLVVGRLHRDQLPKLGLAHVGPGLIVVGLYFFHLRPHLLKSGLASEAFEGWLGPFMIDSVADVWLNMLGFFGYLTSPWLAAPALLLFLLGVCLAMWRGSWAFITPSVVALVIAILASAAGKYPFGCCRHSSWLLGFLVLPIAGVCAVAMTSGRKVAAIGGASLLALGVSAPWIGQLVGAQHAVLEPHSEQLIWRADLESVDELFAPSTESGVVLLSYQTFYTLGPVFKAERESMVYYPNGGFHHFRWGNRDVIVGRAWKFAVHPDLLDRPSHLFNVIQAVDRELPGLRLSEQKQALMFFGGWIESAPIALERANQRLPADQPLATSLAVFDHFQAFEVDLARFQDWFAGYIESVDAEAIN
jgi:hypothetical protein